MKIWRKGETAREWSDNPSEGTITANSLGRFFSLRFSMPSKGSGTTNVWVQYFPKDFGRQLKAMAITDEAALLHAIGTLLITNESALLRAIGQVLVALSSAPVTAKPPVVGFQLASSAPRQPEATQ